MEKDYEIIQNISLAEKKEQEAPEAKEEPVVTVTPPGEASDSPVIEVPQVVVQPPGEVVVAEPEVKIEVPGIVLPEETPAAIETPVAEPVISATVEPEAVQPTYEEPVAPVAEPVSEYSYEVNTDTNDYNSMYSSAAEETTTYNNYDSYKSSYSDVQSYGNDVPSDIDYKDEDSINRYYDQKTQNVINEIEKERAAALDQSKRYKEMASWVNDIGSSFNFFKGRSGF